MSKFYYTNDHEWLKVENDIATIGITNYAQEQLGELVFIDLPELDQEVKKEQPVVVVESVKAASDVYAPVDGKIIKVNEAVIDEPSLVNYSPMEKGWLWQMQLSSPDQLCDLLDEAAYQILIK